MKIEAPITVVKANFDNDEIKALNDAIEVLINLHREMVDRHFTECLWSDYDDEYILELKDVTNAYTVLQNLILLTGLQ